jgi:cytochrome c oxidase assembly factor CtaG
VQWWCSAQGEPWSWTWQAYPGVWVFILLLAAGYARMLRATAPPAAGEGRGVHIACFVAGLVLLWLALDWPIGALGAGYLASVHMIQFLVLGMIVPPLLLYGIPDATYRNVPRRLAGPLRRATRPAVAFVTFNLLVITTHTPLVTDTLMATQLGSFFIDVAWLVGGLIFWWPVVAPAGATSQLRELAKIGYLGLQLIAMKPVFVFLTFSTYPQYATYELAPRIGNISARADQQMAGLLMEVAGMIIILLAVGAVFLKWNASEERQQKAQRQQRGTGLPAGQPQAQ